MNIQSHWYNDWRFYFGMKSHVSLGKQPMTVPSRLSITVCWLQAFLYVSGFPTPRGCTGRSTVLCLHPLSTYKQSQGIIASDAINDCHRTNLPWHLPGYKEREEEEEKQWWCHKPPWVWTSHEGKQELKCNSAKDVADKLVNLKNKFVCLHLS